MRRAPRTAGGLPPRLLPAAEMALVCGSVGAALALLQPLPLCPLRQARPGPTHAPSPLRPFHRVVAH